MLTLTFSNRIMTIVSLSYVTTPTYHDPASWLDRVKPYTVILEALAKIHSVISIEQIDYEGRLTSNGVEYYFIREKNHRIPTTLHQLVKALKPDAVIVHGLDHPLQVIQLRRVLGKTVRLLVQSHAEKIPSGWRRWIQKLADQKVDAYMFASRDMADRWLAKKLIADARKIKEVMVGASVFKPADQFLARRITQVQGQPVFLFVGRVDENKDPLTLIKAFAYQLQWCPSASLYMIFQNEDKRNELEIAIKQSRTEHAIHLVGKVAHSNMESWYNSADFIVSTSHAEAFGMAVAEAMSCGCFPIVANIPSFRKLTNNGEIGILFERGNVQELATAFGNVNQLQMSAIRDQIVQYYNSKLSAEAIANQIHSAVTSISKSFITASTDSSAALSNTRL